MPTNIRHANVDGPPDLRAVAHLCIMIPSCYPPDVHGVAHYWAMAHRLRTSGLASIMYVFTVIQGIKHLLAAFHKGIPFSTTFLFASSSLMSQNILHQRLATCDFYAFFGGEHFC